MESIEQTPASLGAVLDHELLTYEEEVSLSVRARRGDEKAINRFVTCNARFAFSMASKFAHNRTHLDDFFSAAMLGLRKAALKYDAKKKGVNRARFATFATWYIRQQMQQQLYRNVQGVVSITAPAASILSRALRYQKEFVDQHGHSPRDGEVAEALGVRMDKVVSLLAVHSPKSLDAPLLPDGEVGAMHEFLADGEPDAADKAEELGNLAALADALDELPPEEKDILARRFGLNGYSEETLEEVGRKYRVTRERVRQIEAGALKRLRARMSRKSSPLSEIAA